MSKSLLETHRETWGKKPGLRELYNDWYKRITEQLLDGTTLELGGGSGNLKEYSPNVICSDITSVPWLDVVIDGQYLPFKKNTLSNIVLFDVLHHIENPLLFFHDAVHALKPEGRIIIMDPYVSIASWLVYNFLHPEPVDFTQNPFKPSLPDKTRKAFDANQAMSRLLFNKHATEFDKIFSTLTIIHRRYISYFAYPLSGGFDHRSLISIKILRQLLKLEDTLELLGKYLAFRLFIVLEKDK